MKINNEKCKYLLVDGKNVSNFPMTDLSNFHRCDKPFIYLDEIFDYFEIPSEYRYLVVRINPILYKYEAQEYFCGFPFDYTGYTRFLSSDNQKKIRGRALLPYLSNNIEFNTPMVFRDYDDVNKFEEKLIVDGVMEKYKTAISSIFRLQFDYTNVGNLNKYRKLKK